MCLPEGTLEDGSCEQGPSPGEHKRQSGGPEQSAGGYEAGQERHFEVAPAPLHGWLVVLEGWTRCVSAPPPAIHHHNYNYCKH